MRCIECPDFTHGRVPVVAKDMAVDHGGKHVTSSFLLVYEGTCLEHENSTVYSNTECPNQGAA